MSIGATPIDPEKVVAALVMPHGVGEVSVCATCCAFIHEPNGMIPTCENCIQNADALGTVATPITPITLYYRESVTRTWITHYKPDVDNQHGDPAAGQVACAAVMTHLVQQFFDANKWLLQDVDQVVVVPSTHRVPPHPLEEIVRRTSAARLLLEAGLTRTSEELDHRNPNPLAYQGVEKLAGQRVLLIDDVYASGARLQSAAAAAKRAGAHVMRSVVVARRINPGFHPVIQEKWDEATRKSFSWTRAPQNSSPYRVNP